MADDSRQAIEAYVATALKQRFAEAGGAVGEAREKLLDALGALERALAAAGEAEFDLPAELIPAPPPPPPASEVGLVAHVLSAQSEILSAPDQVGLLTQLLLGCTVSCPRVAFFILKKDVLAGWAARGFERAQDADVRSLSIPVGDDTILGAAFRSGKTVKAGRGAYPRDSVFLSRLGGDAYSEAMAVPIWIRDKVAAVLYGDSGRDEQILDPEVPEVLGLHAGLCLETLATRQKYPRQKTGEMPAQAVTEAPSPAPLTSSGPQIAINPPAPHPAPAPRRRLQPRPRLPSSVRRPLPPRRRPPRGPRWRRPWRSTASRRRNESSTRKRAASRGSSSARSSSTTRGRSRKGAARRISTSG